MNSVGVEKNRKKSRGGIASSAGEAKSLSSRRKECSTAKSVKAVKSSDRRSRSRRVSDCFDAIFDRVGKMQDAYGFSSYDWEPIVFGMAMAGASVIKAMLLK